MNKDASYLASFFSFQQTTDWTGSELKLSKKRIAHEGQK